MDLAIKSRITSCSRMKGVRALYCDGLPETFNLSSRAASKLSGERVQKTMRKFNGNNLPSSQLTVDAFSQRVGIRLLEHQDWVESVTRQILAERSRLASELSRLSGLRLFETDTNFFIFKVLEKTAASVFRELVNGGVLVRNVSGYPAMADCLRVNVGTPEENDHFLKTMKMIFPAN